MAEQLTSESSIDEYLDDYEESSVTFSKLHEKETFDSQFFKDSSVTILGESKLLNYKSDLDSILITKEYTNEEKSKYICNPWRLSHDLYGSTEYWHLILLANNIYSATEFTQTTVKVYDGSLPTMVDTILSYNDNE